jgi:hypothetical protein
VPNKKRNHILPKKQPDLLSSGKIDFEKSWKMALSVMVFDSLRWTARLRLALGRRRCRESYSNEGFGEREKRRYGPIEM